MEHYVKLLLEMLEIIIGIDKDYIVNESEEEWHSFFSDETIRGLFTGYCLGKGVDVKQFNKDFPLPESLFQMIPYLTCNDTIKY